MSNIGVQGQFYLGVVSKYPGTSMDFMIEADIPGVIQGVKAYPLRGDCDEPKPGDPVILLGLDPEYNSYYLYWKLKENDFTGFRVMGQQVSFDKDKGIRISIDGRANAEDTANFPEDSAVLPGEVSHVDLDLHGNITAENISGTKIQIDKEGNVYIDSKQNIIIKENGGTIGLAGYGRLNLGYLSTDTGTRTGFINTNSFGPAGTPIPLTGEVMFTGKWQ